ncbi:hypothetical protein GCK32_010385, partial [Trichostrongylus colubriformis]
PFQKRYLQILTQLAVQEMSAQISKHGNTDNSFSDPKFKEEMEVVQKICHNTEVRTYKHMMKVPKEKMHIPQIYYAKMFTDWNPVKGYLIMEYFDNLKAVHMYENIAPQYLKQVLRYKAVMESSSLDMPQEERQMYTSPFKTLFEAVYSQKVLDHVMALFRKFNDGKMADKADRLQAILPEMVDLERVDDMASNLGMESVLCHGDLWSMNILWRQSGDDLTMAAVVDYQTAHFGCAATDLVRLFTTCLSGKDRQTQWEPLLEEFYGYLKQEVGERKMPYTLEQLKEAYRQYFPMGAFMIAPKIGPYFEMVHGSSSDDAKKKTNVYWDDLQKSIHDAFGADAIFGPNKEIKNIGSGNGFMSRMCLVSPDWQKELEGVPREFIVKICSQLPLMECHGLDETGHLHSSEFAAGFQDDIMMFHNHECHLYELLRKYNITDIPSPKVYCTRKYSEQNPLKGFIVMEYIADAVPYHIFDNVEPESMLQVMRAIAKLEAAAMRFSDEEKLPFRCNPLHEHFTKFFTKEAIDSHLIVLRSIGGGRLMDKVDQLEDIIEEIIDLEHIRSLPEMLGMKRVLCHGDLWSNNLIWKKRGDTVELAAVVDFQTVHIGLSTMDIVRVLCACMSGNDRKVHWESIVEKFYSYLEEELETSDMPYTIDMVCLLFIHNFNLRNLI